MKKILYFTDLYYSAKGRKYYDEDFYITKMPKDYFDIVLCNPKLVKALNIYMDLIVFRNTGHVSEFKKDYKSFVKN